MPCKRAAQARRGIFGEISRELAREKAAEQAARCSQSRVPFCQSGCPLQNNIPDWLKATADGQLHEASDLSAAANTFPEICGRICPQDRLCEGTCVTEQSGHGKVTIGAGLRGSPPPAWFQATVYDGCDRADGLVVWAIRDGREAADAMARRFADQSIVAAE